MAATPKTVVLSVDVEPDVAMYVDGIRGLSEGLERLIDVFRRLDVSADYFFTVDAARVVADFARAQASESWLGCHGLRHRPSYYSRRSPDWQRQTIVDATKGLEAIAGVKPKMFRTPNFSVTGTILESLEGFGYAADSSILPGRHKRLYRFLPLTDHRMAPRVPYHPSSADPCEPGELHLWEFPVTENPLSPGAPIGLGFVNVAGVEAAVRAIRQSAGSPITILCHPWEAIDLQNAYPGVPGWLASTCSSDLRPFETLLRTLVEDYEVVRLRDLVRNGFIGMRSHVREARAR